MGDNVDALFQDMEDLIPSDKHIVDGEDIVEEINIDNIEEQAKQDSLDMCKNLREIYFDEKFMNDNPLFKKRLDVELESLRVLIKMRKSDEIAHDLCLKSIGGNSNNASLYAALARIQSSMLSIQKQMDDTVKNINMLLKNVQLELSFDKETGEPDSSPVVGSDPNVTRGSKRFIQQMNEELEADKPIQENDIFATNEPQN
jgi:hypothetical protein